MGDALEAAISKLDAGISNWNCRRPPPYAYSRHIHEPHATQEKCFRDLAKLYSPLSPLTAATEASGIDRVYSIFSFQQIGRVDACLFEDQRSTFLELLSLARTVDWGRCESGELLRLSYFAYVNVVGNVCWFAHVMPFSELNSTGWSDLRTTCEKSAALAFEYLTSKRGSLTKQGLSACHRSCFALGAICNRCGDHEKAIEAFRGSLIAIATLKELGYSDAVADWELDYYEALYMMLESSYESREFMEWHYIAAFLQSTNVGPYTQVHSSLYKSVDDEMVLRPGVPLLFNDDVSRGYDSLPADAAFVRILLTNSDVYYQIRVGKESTFNRVRMLGAMSHQLTPIMNLVRPYGGEFSPCRELGATRGSDLSAGIPWLLACRRVEVIPSDEGTWQWRYIHAQHLLEDSSLWRETLYVSFLRGLRDRLLANGIRRIILSLDGGLYCVPFHLLRDEGTQRLCDEFFVSYVPNEACMALTCDFKLGTGSKALVVLPSSRVLELKPEECSNVCELIGPSCAYLTSVESIEAVLQESHECELFHFGGHGQFFGRDGTPAGLQLSMDQWMGIAEIQQLRLKRGALVVLPACETGRCRVDARTTVNSLVNAFLNAGASTVIATFWEIDSRASAIFCFWFYDALIVKGLSRGESMQFAIEKLRSGTLRVCEDIMGCRLWGLSDQPFEAEKYWGAFALFGAA